MIEGIFSFTTTNGNKTVKLIKYTDKHEHINEVLTRFVCDILSLSANLQN